MCLASACVIAAMGMIIKGGHGGLEQQQVYFVLTANGFPCENRPQMLLLKIVRQGVPQKYSTFGSCGRYDSATVGEVCSDTTDGRTVRFRESC